MTTTSTPRERTGPAAPPPPVRTDPADALASALRKAAEREPDPRLKDWLLKLLAGDAPARK